LAYRRVRRRTGRAGIAPELCRMAESGVLAVRDHGTGNIAEQHSRCRNGIDESRRSYYLMKKSDFTGAPIARRSILPRARNYRAEDFTCQRDISGIIFPFG